MQNNISYIQPIKVLGYFDQLHNLGALYSVLNSCKGALSQIVFFPLNSSILEHLKIKKQFKGVYNLRLPTEKITFVWNVKILFDYFSHKRENDQLSDKSFTQKLLILLLLLIGQRMNTVYFHRGIMTVTDMWVTFSCNLLFKHSESGKKLDSFPIQGISQQKVMCARLSKRMSNTNTKALFITYGKPFRPATIDSMRRWVKQLFIERIFILKEHTPHSCRSAATSKTNQLNINIGLLKKTTLYIMHQKMKTS